MILGGCLGSSVSNPGHLPLLYSWAGEGELVQFPAALKHAAQITTKNCTSAVNGEGSFTCSSYMLCAQTEQSFPPSPDRETRSGVPVRPQSLSSAVFSCPFTGGPLGPETGSSTPPSSVCVYEWQARVRA